MGKTKHAVGTPKWIDNRQKAKCLNKLRWYCQMCRKSCRDQNGFKCHIMSESHQRQLQVFNENPTSFIDDYSKEFLEGYTTLLRLRFNGHRVHANQAYKEYIGDRHHMHMNATIWETLTEFVHWLGKNDICKIENTERGWFVTYIDQNPWDIGKKKKKEKDDHERERDYIARQVEQAKESAKGTSSSKPDSVASSLKRKRTDERIQLDLKVKNRLGAPKVVEDEVGESVKKAFKIKTPGDVDDEAESWNIEDVRDKMFSLEELVANDPDNVQNVQELKKQVERLEMLIEREKAKVLRKQEKDSSSSDEDDERMENWIRPGIVVKVMAKSLGDKFYQKKGFVRELAAKDKFAAIVVMLDASAGRGKKVKVDQAYLETVIPGIGKRVIVCNGRNRGQVATLKAIDREKYNARLEIRRENGDLLEVSLPYEDFSKAHQQELAG